MKSDKTSSHRKVFTILRSIFFTLLLIGLIYLFWINQGFFTWVSFLGAAFVVALSAFISSLAAYFYINTSVLFEPWDIIHVWTWASKISWEVEIIGVFFTTIKEIDDGLLFTGKTISFPNNMIFANGLQNSTKKDTLIRHDFKFTIAIWNKDPIANIDKVKHIVDDVYKSYMIPKNKDTHTSPKIIYTISEKGLEFHIRVLVHFNKMIDMHNKIMDRIMIAHQKWEINLIVNKDTKRLENIVEEIKDNQPSSDDNQNQ